MEEKSTVPPTETQQTSSRERARSERISKLSEIVKAEVLEVQGSTSNGKVSVAICGPDEKRYWL